MAFKGFEDTRRRLYEEYHSHVDDWVRERVASGRIITHAEFQEMRGNSWERKLLYPLLDNEALIHLTRYCIGNSSPMRDQLHGIPAVYDESVIHVLAPLLIQRLEKAEKEIERLQGLVALEARAQEEP